MIFTWLFKLSKGTSNIQFYSFQISGYIPYYSPTRKTISMNTFRCEMLAIWNFFGFYYQHSLFSSFLSVILYFTSSNNLIYLVYFNGIKPIQHVFLVVFMLDRVSVPNYAFYKLMVAIWPCRCSQSSKIGWGTDNRSMFMHYSNILGVGDNCSSWNPILRDKWVLADKNTYFGTI